MTNVAPLTVYTANERDNAQNCMYPNRIEITDEESAVVAFSRDLTGPWGRYKKVADFKLKSATGDCLVKV